MNPIKQLLFKRLVRLGLEITMIPGFVRMLANTLLVCPGMNRMQVNKRMQYLGWSGPDVDEQTLQLAITCFEDHGLKRLEYKPARWFEANFLPKSTGTGALINGVKNGVAAS